MATHAEDSTLSSKWQDGLRKAVNDSRWSQYDCEIQNAVNEINRHLRGTAGFRPIEWRLIKAMLWVETGAAKPEWRTNPMQIGVAGDPGLQALLSENECGSLIMPPNWRSTIKLASARSIPAHNIRAGIAYLLMRASKSEYQSVVDPDSSVLEVTVSQGDTLARLAKIHGTTAEIFRQLNPTVAFLKQGQVLRYRKGSVRRVIVGWRAIDVNQVARLYNGGGDPKYAKKLSHAFTLVKEMEAARCE